MLFNDNQEYPLRKDQSFENMEYLGTQNFHSPLFGSGILFVKNSLHWIIYALIPRKRGTQAKTCEKVYGDVA